MPDNTTWDNIKTNLVDGLKQVFPIIGKERDLHLEDVEIKDNKDASDYASQKQAILNKTNWTVPVYGNLVLKDKEGKVLERSKTRLLSVPKFTARNTIIYNGNEYSIANQIRLKPGVYTNTGDDGVTRSQFNVGKGANFSIWQEPAKGIFYIQFNQASIPLYPVLKEIGVSDEDLSIHWGKEILDSNKQISDVKYKNAVIKVYNKLTYNKDEEKETTYDTARSELKNVLSAASLDPLVTKATLKKEYSSVTPDTILNASRKILKINRGEEQPDDRESLVYKSVHGPDDFIRESITKGARPVLWKIKNRLNSMYGKQDGAIIKNVFAPGALSSPLYTNINISPLASVVQDANPLKFIEASNRITAFGPGGIGSAFAIPESVRNIHPSQIGFIDTVRTQESDKAGIDLQLAVGVKKTGDTLSIKLLDRDGNKVRKTLQELQGKTLALPGQQQKDKIDAVRDGKLVTVVPSAVDYTIYGPNRMFSDSTVLVPFLSNNAGARANLGGKMGAQALPLKYREKPLVQTAANKEGLTNEAIVGRKISVQSPVDGKVTRATGQEVEIADSSGNKHSISLYNNYIVGNKTYLNHEPVVKEGDLVKAGQLLADSTYTKDGVLAMGTNLKTIYVPYMGQTHEDAIVVSDSAAQKFTSQHMSRFDLPVDDTTVLNKNKWLAYFENKATPAQMDKLDTRGIIKPGIEVNSGDYLIAAMRENVVNPEDAMLGKLSRKLVKPYRDVSVLWERANAGRVVDVVVNPKSVTVTIRTDAPLVIGDKITNREGGKGVVATILPDAEMPKDMDGKPYEVILNPATVMSRMNIGQLLETATSKMATPDKPYIAPLFPHGKEGNISKEVKKVLDKQGIKETEEVYDASGKKVGDIFAGKQYFYKLGKTTDTNYSARAFQGSYDVNMMPVRGGEEGAKGIGLLDIYALLSHNARNILRESVTSKAEYNPEYFKAIQMGNPLPAPKPTFAFEKFVNYLKGAGVNVEKTGDRLKLLPFIDKDVLRISSGKIENAKMLKTKDLAEERGGFFDFNKTGGKTGNKWSHVELAEPVLNPLFIEPARRLLGLREKDLIGLQNNSGGKVIKEMLSGIDVNKRIEELTSAAGNLSGAKKDDAIKQLKYLKVLKESNITPAEAYTMRYLPVIPPLFRPIYPTGGNGNMRVGDINNLYKQAFLVNEGLGDKALDAMPEEEKKSLRRELFNSVKALQGLDKPVSGKDLKGFIAAIKGDTPKEGFFQSKLLKKQQDIAGRATIGGDPSLGLDEIKMPEDMAWTLYGPFVIGEMVKSGMKIIDAETELKERTDKARSVLLMVMKDRPVLLNRAPTLHKFNIMAFKPTPYSGKTLLIPPMVMKPYGADVDGDAMQVHVPVSEEARREALNKMLPSKNLFSILDKSPHYAPSNEAVFGLYLGTKERKGSPLKTYQNTEDVIKDLNTNRIQATDPILLQNIRTTAGNVKVNTVLPFEFRDYNRVITKKSLSEILKQVGQKYPSDYARIAKELKDLGDTWAFSPEASLSFKDFELPDVRDKILSEAGLALARKGTKKDADVIDVYTKAQDKLIPALMEEGKKKENKFYEWAASGSRGNPVQFSSIWGAPVLVTDLQDRVIPRPIKRNFIEGLTPGEYFTSLYGTRKGITATKTEVQLPGALAKELVASNVDLLVTMLDCGTRKGIDFDISDRDALDRLAAVDVQDASGSVLVRRNSIITSRVMDSLRKGGVQTIKARSVTTCEAPKGVCSSCAGIQEDGKLPGIGENIGTKHSMSIAEPLTQMALSTKHTAGIGSKGTGISAIKTILEMPASTYTKEILAHQDGTINDVKKLPTGGHIVTVKGTSTEDYLIPPGHRLLKTTGPVSQGEPLTDGSPNIQDYVAIKGIEAGRNKLTETIRDFYRSGGRRIDRRVPETVARGILNYAKVVSPGDFDLVEGDVVEYNQAAPMQTKKVVSLLPSQAIGYRLADPHGRFSKDTRIDRDIAKSLSRSSGLKKIGVYKEPARLEPVAFGINKIPVMKKDWLSRLGFRYLSDTITEGAATGMESNLHSMNPIPALAYGAEFGQGKEFDVY